MERCSARRERPRGSRAAEQCHELAALHSITSSTRARSYARPPSIYRHAARPDRPGPFVDLGGNEFGKVFGASALGRCNLLTNRFEAFADERQIKGGAQRLIEVPDDQVRSVLR